jgi:D-beta-D-heptose 7-phosphate kinase/D-beta-D-heptose 1-phosphate adenosyltransferase
MSDTLLDILDRWQPFKALVIGDFMLDEHLYGEAERLSADAPVPILHVRRRDSRPGGAANVCLDLLALRASVEAIGIVGADEFGRTLTSLLTGEGMGTSGLVSDASRPTTVKQNLVGLAQGRHPQKMFRLDHESREPIAAEIERELLKRVQAKLAWCDVVCIEDYAKGVCSEAFCQQVIGLARQHGKPVFVDPAKLSDYSRYRGATTITPNRTEAEFATGMSTHVAADAVHNAAVANQLLGQLQLECCVLTLDKHGALLVERGGTAVSVPTLARQVYDVTGAGDEFLAGLAAARANGASWKDAVRFANAAAGLEVEVFGVQPIPVEKIHHSLLKLRHTEQGRTDAAKLRTLSQLQVEIASRRKDGEKIAFTNGCFDILHTGHISLLQQARDTADALIVAINSDASVRKLKGPTRPVNSEVDRARVLSALECVDAVVIFGEETPLELIQALQPDVLIKGGDYTRESVVGADVVEARGGKVVLVPLVAGKSTTAVLSARHIAK